MGDLEKVIIETLGKLSEIEKLVSKNSQNKIQMCLSEKVNSQGTQEKDQQWIGLSNCILPGLRP